MKMIQEEMENRPPMTGRDAIRNAGAMIMKQGSLTNLVNGRPSSQHRSPTKEDRKDDLRVPD